MDQIKLTKPYYHNHDLLLIPTLSQFYFYFRRQLTGGETIQSYNHQQVRKEESFPHSHTSDISPDDDNIDVVNDDDKDSGKYLVIMWCAVIRLLSIQQKTSSLVSLNQT